MNLLLKALNDDTRRQILELLRDGELNAGEIADHFNMTKPSISHHLDMLKQAGVIESERRGQFIVYTLNTTVVDELLTWLMQLGAKTKKGKSSSFSKISVYGKNA